MRLPKHVTLVPIGTTTLVVGLLILAYLPFFVGATKIDQSEQTLLFGFNEVSGSQIEAYLDHKVDGNFNGKRAPTYPVARIDIVRNETWYAPPHPRKRSRSNLVKLYSTDSFKIRIMDGDDFEYWQVAWDYPPMDQREPRVIELGSMLDQGIQELPADQQESLRRIFTGRPDPVDPIPEPRQSNLVKALQSKLTDLGYLWINNGIDRGEWTKSEPNYRGWILLAVGVVSLMSFGIVIDRLRSKRRTTPSRVVS
jgi:hypothetical protein